MSMPIQCIVLLNQRSMHHAEFVKAFAHNYENLVAIFKKFGVFLPNFDFSKSLKRYP